jgi:hypothetical protein
VNYSLIYLFIYLFDFFRYYTTLTKVGTLLGIISMISVIGVANFEYRNAPAVHMTFAGLLFVLADVYLAMMTRIGKKTTII